MKNIILISILFFTTEFFGCSCIFYSIEESINRFDLIFSGTVMSKKKTDSGIEYVVQSNSFWKGDEEKEIKLHTGYGGPDCGIKLEIGQLYIIWANKKNNETYLTNRCSKTELFNKSLRIDYLNYVFHNNDYSETNLTANELLVLTEFVNQDKSKIEDVELFYHNEKLVAKIDFLDRISNVSTNINFISFNKNELKKLPDNAKNGLLIITEYRNRMNKRKRIIKNISKASCQQRL